MTLVVTNKLEQSRDSWNKVSELITQGKPKRASLWKKAAEASECSAEEIREAFQTCISGNEEDAEQLKYRAWNSYYVSDTSTWLLKSEDASEKAYQMLDEKRDFWEAISEQYKRVADYNGKASEANDCEKNNVSTAWYDKASSLLAKINYEIKAYEAEEAGKTALAGGYREAAVTLEQVINQFNEAIQVYSEEEFYFGPIVEYNNLAVKFLQAKAEYQMKSGEAEEAKKLTLAKGYREAVGTLEQAINQFDEAIQIYCRGGNSYLESCWKSAGESFQTKAEYQIKAREAEEAGKTTLAKSYKDAIAILEQAIDCWKSRSGEIAQALQKKAEFQIKACVMEGAETSELATNSHPIRADADKTICSNIGATKSFVAESDFEGRCLAITSQIEEVNQAFREKLGGENSYLWNCIAIKLEQSRDSWNKVKELTREGKMYQTTNWKKAAEESETSAEKMRQAVLAYILEDHMMVQALEKVAWDAYYLSDASTWTLKAGELVEKAGGKVQIGKIDWNIVDQYQDAAVYKSKALAANKPGEENERNSWHAAGNSLHACSNYQEKASEAEEAGKTALAVGYRKAAEASKRSADQWEASALAKAAGCESEYTRLRQAAETTQKEADAIAKKAEEKS